MNDKINYVLKKYFLPVPETAATTGYSLFVDGKKTEYISDISTEAIGIAKLETIGSHKRTQVGKDYMTTVGVNHVDIVGSKRSIKAGDTIQLIAGKSRLKLSADGTIELTGVHIKLIANKIDLN
ncbi:hypothetical protein [Consotaella aegiceratis]|uniref:hypothetical protein n=1 Tax=Consotaella aegiceratis TaxID=3097961 RepID=UPI002F3F859B